MVLTARVALLALLGVPLVAVSPWPAATFAVLLAALAVLVAIDVVLAAAPSALDYARSGPESARLGQPAELRLVIRNDGARRFRGLVRDAWAPSARAEPRQHRVDLPAGGFAVVETRLRPIRRGEQHAAAVTARSLGPLGLAGRQASRPLPGELRVLPPFLSRKHLPSRLARLRQIDGAIPVLIRGQGTEFDSLREYVVGDDVRSIDWRATARRADVVVRTWRPERDRRVVLVLDTGRTSAGRVGVDPTALDNGADAAGPFLARSSLVGPAVGWPRLDWSMDAALLMAALAARAGDHVDFLAYDREPRAGVFGAGRTELLARLVDAMAPLEPALIESDAAGMVSEVSRRTRGRALVVILTELNASALEEGLLPVLPQLSARHQVIIAAVADPRVDTLAAGRADAAQVYDAAAAERSRNERRGIASRLRGMGVEVVDAEPEELAPALADTYLAMKASGRL
ncbi:DUF58 domain-containing protein [Mycolicibacterium brumae]|uniref:DUF58 domain-containing protein n=1 Tax=Mycolicibacterium brumae TaxID=85968 RepID=UPI000FE1B1A2|nr:DUF58 domain-containing protein [Mycolicibacterium brumae]MCV7193385.1 DUF58 domain-containing protein [Mycolicibacterium brumae]RWA22251.1 hypothetical protein MBRU_13240 [Mycolicibacterium brumae DSM 44177]